MTTARGRRSSFRPLSYDDALRYYTKHGYPPPGWAVGRMGLYKKGEEFPVHTSRRSTITRKAAVTTELRSYPNGVFRDYLGGGDTVNVFFNSSASDAHAKADKIARVIESALNNPEGRWRLEKFDNDWVLKYGPFNRSEYRKVEAAIQRKFGNSMFVLYTTGR